ncbi:MAG TPA: hypothetical protein VK465_13590 [Fibrobacteria bacterium]|nr:hypothetical protein [Fibrobacteria bacterium]
MDERGEIAEDLRTQILGQLSERISYESLYRQALADPELKRTKVELDEAMTNAKEAREVVWELFQDLQGFSLEEYRPFQNLSDGMERIRRFFAEAAESDRLSLKSLGDGRFALCDANGSTLQVFTSDRDTAVKQDKLDLFGLDHPLIARYLQAHQQAEPEVRGASLSSEHPGVLTWWLIEVALEKGQKRFHWVPVGCDKLGRRNPRLERAAGEILHCPPGEPVFPAENRLVMLREHIGPMLERELIHRGILQPGSEYQPRLMGWAEMG